MSAAVSKLEALLERVKRNRVKPRLVGHSASSSGELTREVATPAVRAPMAPSQPQEPARMPAAPSVAPAEVKRLEPPAAANGAPAQMKREPLPAPVAPNVAPPGPPAAKPVDTVRDARDLDKPVSEKERDLDKPVSEKKRDLDEPVPEKKKAPAPSPLELAVESSVRMPLDTMEFEPPVAEAHAAPEPERAVPEPERIVAENVQPTGPIAKLTSTLEAPVPATFGELLERTLNLKIH